MGCSSSKVDDEESVRLCKDRKKFIKQAVQYRLQFASGHIAYIQSMKRVSAALRDYVEVDEPREFLLDAFTATRALPPVKKVKSGFISIEPKSLRVNYFRPWGRSSVSVEERPQSPETFRIHTYNPMNEYGMEGVFPMQSPPPNNRPNLAPPSPPQNTQWDFFWNPFDSLDYYGYPTTSGRLESEILDDDGDDNDRLRHVREKEGIPDLEEESEHEEPSCRETANQERVRLNPNFNREEVLVEDVDDSDDDDDSDDEVDEHIDTERHVQGLNSNLNNRTQGLKSNGNQHVQGLNTNANHRLNSNATNHHFQGLHPNGNPHFQGSNSNANRHYQEFNSNATNHHFQGSNTNAANRHFQGLHSNGNPHFQGSNSNAANQHFQGLHSNGNPHFQESNSNAANQHFQGLHSNGNPHFQGSNSNAANHHFQGSNSNAADHHFQGSNSNAADHHFQGSNSNAANNHFQGSNSNAANNHFQGLHSNGNPHFQESNSNSANHHFQGPNSKAGDHRFQGLNSNGNPHFQGSNSNAANRHFQGSNSNAADHRFQGLNSNATNHHYQELNSNGNSHFQGSNSNANRHVQGLKSNDNHHVQGLKSNANHGAAVARAQNTGQLSTKETAVADCSPKEEAPGFRVYVNRRPTSMAEVIKDLEAQFTVACNSAKEVSSILQAIRAQYSSTSNDLKSMKMLNPVAMFRSASSRSSSSRFLINPSILKDEYYQSSSDLSDDSSTFSSSHQSTLDRLYIWERKLYQEVRAGERVRLAYEKKCAHLRSQDVNGADPSSLEKTRAAIRELHTQIKISIHSVESISKRIETLRDDELQPQLLQLVEGLGKMWKVMAECHHIQKRTLDDAKLLLASTPSVAHSGTRKYTIMSPSEPHQLARSAANLETEIRNWRACFESWIASQRSYCQAIKGWLLRCLHADSDTSKLLSPCSPPRRTAEGAPPIFNICIRWSRLLESVRELPVLEGLDFFAAGVGSLYAHHQMKEDSRWNPGGGSVTGPAMELVEVGRRLEGSDEEEIMTAEKMAEVAIKVLCAGMSFSVSSLTEFALVSAEGYTDLLKNWEDRMQDQDSSRNGNCFTV